MPRVSLANMTRRLGKQPMDFTRIDLLVPGIERLKGGIRFGEHDARVARLSGARVQRDALLRFPVNTSAFGSNFCLRLDQGRDVDVFFFLFALLRFVRRVAVVGHFAAFGSLLDRL